MKAFPPSSTLNRRSFLPLGVHYFSVDLNFVQVVIYALAFLRLHEPLQDADPVEHQAVPFFYVVIRRLPIEDELSALSAGVEPLFPLFQRLDCEDSAAGHQ
jgi:hypothetical protein